MAILNLNKDLADRVLISNFLRFTGQLIPYNTTNAPLLNTRTRALCVKGGVSLNTGVKHIPYFNYEQSKDTVTSIVKEAGTLNDQLNVCSIHSLSTHFIF